MQPIKQLPPLRRDLSNNAPLLSFACRSFPRSELIHKRIFPIITLWKARISCSRRMDGHSSNPSLCSRTVADFTDYWDARCSPKANQIARKPSTARKPVKSWACTDGWRCPIWYKLTQIYDIYNVKKCFFTPRITTSRPPSKSDNTLAGRCVPDQKSP